MSRSRAILRPIQVDHRFARRRFLRQSALAAAGVAFPALLSSAARGADGHVAPSNRIGVGMIGVGGYGAGVLKSFLFEAGARVVAVCDVHRGRLREAQDTVNAHYENRDCAAYHDFRELIARPDIDAVAIATPDHWHLLIALAAVRAGKDVYLEKPLSLTIGEGQLLRDEIKRRRRVFQFGTFQRASANFRRACEMVRSGYIGAVERINVWCIGSVPGGSTAPTSVPDGLDYDFWLGPAPEKTHRENLCFAKNNGWSKWFFNSDYSIGFIAGWGIHPMDIASWGYPTMHDGRMEIGGAGKFPSEGICDTATEWDVNFTFASGVVLNFRGLPVASGRPEDRSRPFLWRERYGRTRDHGTAFEGKEGWILVDRDHLDAHPKSLLKENPARYPAKMVHRSAYHAEDFLNCIRTRKQTIADIGDSFQTDALCHLANLALRTQRKLKWDPRAERFVEDPAANRLIAPRAMRKPWSL